MKPARHLSSRAGAARRQRQAGLTIVELMVALILGLLLIGGTVNIFIANRQAFRTTDQLARMQENTRIAFELMARSLREAGGTPCGGDLPTGNVVKNASTNWWSNWQDGIHGYEGDEAFPPKADGTDAAERVAGTDAVILMYGYGDPPVTITEHNAVSAQFKVSTSDHGLVDGEIALVCDYRQAAIFQITNVNSSNSTVVHNTGAGVADPGNCSKGLGYPTDCSSTNGTSYSFQEGGNLVRLASEGWYVGYNGRGGKSLYRMRLKMNGAKPEPEAEEIAEGVQDMQIQYLVADGSGTPAASYVDADSVDAAEWREVIAARLTLSLESTENVAVDGTALKRQLIHVVGLRNRLQ
nr:PilW family protein [uncultured Caldimonas sp.]